MNIVGKTNQETGGWAVCLLSRLATYQVKLNYNFEDRGLDVLLIDIFNIFGIS